MISLNNSLLRPLSKIHFDQIKMIPQDGFCNCYMMSSLKALAASKKGQKMLSESILQDDKFFTVIFKGVKKTNTYKHPKNPYPTIINVMEGSMNWLVSKHPRAKPLVSRMFYPYHEKLEMNKASNFLKLLTGKKPVNIGDNGFIPLSMRPKKTMELLKKISQSKAEKSPFVAGSNLLFTNNKIKVQHYYMIDKIDMNKNNIRLLNPRTTKNNSFVELTIKEFLNNFRSIVGFL